MADNSTSSNDPSKDAAEFFKAGAQASGGLLGGLTALLGKVGELAEKGKELQESGEFKQGDKTAKYGVNVRMGLGDGLGMPGGSDTPSVAPVNDASRRQRKESAARVREPEVDVFTEENAVVLVAELPGIAADGVTIETAEIGVRLNAANDQYRFEKSIEISHPIDAAAAEIESNNGVFEIRLPRV